MRRKRLGVSAYVGRTGRSGVTGYADGARPRDQRPTMLGRVPGTVRLPAPSRARALPPAGADLPDDFIATCMREIGELGRSSQAVTPNGSRLLGYCPR